MRTIGGGGVVCLLQDLVLATYSFMLFGILSPNSKLKGMFLSVFASKYFFIF